MRSSTRQAKKAAKAKLSGAISSNKPKNNKIVFGDDADGGDSVDDDGIQNEGIVNEDGSGEEENSESDSGNDDMVEEVKGSAARETTQKLRQAERKTAKESILKKKRKKKDDVGPAVDAGNNDSSDSEDEEEGDLLTDDFFKKVDSERADQLQKAKRDKKIKKVKQKGKHTTFVVEDEYKMTDAPHTMGQNIEVIAIGGMEATGITNNGNDERQLLLSATLGSAPSKGAIAFARGSMKRGTMKERGSDSRKRKSKNDETWKRSRKLNKLGGRSRPGQAATLFLSRM